MSENKAVFLDRDGVLNKVVFRGSSKPIAPWSIEEFKPYEGIQDPLMQFKALGYLLFVVSNQPDISKGLVDRQTVEKMNDIITSSFPIKSVVYCPHEDKHKCACRKPKPGMIIKLADEYDIDLEKSYMVGDNWKDILAGKEAGCETILVKRKYNRTVSADYRVQSLQDIIGIIK